ncbi:MAG: glycine cleavage system aminomethyltransferase GcvT [Bdellovibrionales bacterium]|nr:glycine cleavage system aminomethyltransferase GcvT [Bdellovibrionales bacterium]
MSSELQRTFLYKNHLNAKGRMVPFAGWEMPVQYIGLKEEHVNVRTNVGLFDVSHMGEIFFRGPKAVEALEFMTTNAVAKLEEGKAHYSLIPNEHGGIVDDIIVYCLKKNQEYLVCVNASNIEKDFAHFLKYNRGADIKNESADWSQIAVQGPKAFSLLERVVGIKDSDIASFEIKKLKYKSKDILVARTGYTGEDGVEIFIENASVSDLWDELLEKGSDLSVMPIGLGARDTLRTEVKFPLYGHEITDETSPYEALLGWVVKLDKGDFLGKGHMERVKQAGLSQKLVGLVMEDKGIPRDGYELFLENGEKIGKVTSGTMSPTLGIGIALAYVQSKYTEIGTPLWIDIRGRKAKAKVVKAPLIKK